MNNELKPLWKLGKKDFLKGLVVAVLVSMLATLQQLLKSKGLDIGQDQLMNILNAGLISGVGYLIKNLSTDEEGKIGGMF